MPASDVYRHQARRLRQQYAGQPGVLQYSLRELSRRYDRAHPSLSSPRVRMVEQTNSPAVQHVEAVPASRSPDKAFARAVVDWFAEQVASQFAGKLMHHSQRRELLKTAERLGIGRFHANLIIAVAQHEAEARPSRTSRMVPITGRLSFAAIAAMVITQGLIVWGAWRILHFC